MRREVAIIAGVLVPFAVLVALGFWFSGGEVEAPLPGAVVVRAPDAAVGVAVEGVEKVVRVDAGFASSPRPSPPREEREMVVMLVRQCLEDRRQAQVRVKRVPARDGGVRVIADTQDPYLAACVEDVFEEVPWEPGDVADSYSLER